MSAIDWTSINSVVATVSWWQPGVPWGQAKSGDVYNNTFQPFTSDQQLVIATILFEIHSAVAAKAADDGGVGQAQDFLNALNSVNGLNIYQSISTLPGVVNPSEPNTIGINGTGIANTYSFNPQGYFVQETPQLMIAHELSHTLIGTTDPTTADQLITDDLMNAPNYDYNGGAVDFANSIAPYLGLAQRLARHRPRREFLGQAQPAVPRGLAVEPGVRRVVVLVDDEAQDHHQDRRP